MPAKLEYGYKILPDEPQKPCVYRTPPTRISRTCKGSRGYKTKGCIRICKTVGDMRMYVTYEYAAIYSFSHAPIEF